MRLPHLLRMVLLVTATMGGTLRAQPVKAPRLDAVGDPLPPQALHRFGTSRFCTQTEVVLLVLSQDGKLLAAADREGRVYLWETDTGKRRLATAADTGKRVAISPDGQWLALGDGAPFEIRNLKKDGPPRLPIGNVRAFAFTPDSKAVVVLPAEGDDLILYEIENGKEVRSYVGLQGTIAAIAFSPDGKLFAAAASLDDKEKPCIRIVIWDALNGDKRKEITYVAKQVQRLVFLADNKTLIGQFGSSLTAWNATTGERLDKIAHNVGSSFALDSAGKILATTDGPKVVEFSSGKEMHEFDTPTVLRHVAMSGDGKLLVASPARFESASPRLLMWDLTTGKERTGAEEHRHYVDAVAFSLDGLKIATASNVEGVARVWDAKSAKLLHALNLDRLAARKSGGPRSRSTLIDGLAFSPLSSQLYVAGQRWNLTTGEPIELKGDADFAFEQTNSVRAVLSPDGRLAASILHDRAILFWEPTQAKAIQKIEPLDKKERGSWSALAFSPNGKLFATGKLVPRNPMDEETPYEETVYLWDIAAGKLVKKLRSRPGIVVRLMFSPDGETLAVFSVPAKLELWHLPTGRLLREMSLAEDLPSTFSTPTVAFAPHGQWLAFTFQEGEIVFLETLTGKQIHTLRGHQGYVSSVAFAPDSRRLLSGGRDTTALLWSVMPENPALPPSWKDDDKLWQQLASSPDQAYRAVWALMAHPERALEVLSKRLQPAGGVTEKEIRDLIKNLSSPKFAQRDVAIRRLKVIGTASLPALEQSLKDAPDLETKRRIQELIQTAATALTPELLGDVRALQILEMIGTPPARKLLAEIARGEPTATKTRLAQAALTRSAR